jgi:hypothetical protein
MTCEHTADVALALATEPRVRHVPRCVEENAPPDPSRVDWSLMTPRQRIAFTTREPHCICTPMQRLHADWAALVAVKDMAAQDTPGEYPARDLPSVARSIAALQDLHTRIAAALRAEERTTLPGCPVCDA